MKKADRDGIVKFLDESFERNARSKQPEPETGKQFKEGVRKATYLLLVCLFQAFRWYVAAQECSDEKTTDPLAINIDK